MVIATVNVSYHQVIRQILYVYVDIHGYCYC